MARLSVALIETQHACANDFIFLLTLSIQIYGADCTQTAQKNVVKAREHTALMRFRRMPMRNQNPSNQQS